MLEERLKKYNSLTTSCKRLIVRLYGGIEFYLSAPSYKFDLENLIFSFDEIMGDYGLLVSFAEANNIDISNYNDDIDVAVYEGIKNKIDEIKY